MHSTGPHLTKRSPQSSHHPAPQSLPLLMSCFRRAIDHPLHFRNHSTLIILHLHHKPSIMPPILLQRLANLRQPLLAQPTLPPHPPPPLLAQPKPRPHPSLPRFFVTYRRGLVPNHILASQIRRHHDHVER